MSELQFFVELARRNLFIEGGGVYRRLPCGGKLHVTPLMFHPPRPGAGKGDRALDVSGTLLVAAATCDVVDAALLPATEFPVAGPLPC